MKRAPAHLIYESAYRGNIIPLTSVCNISCVFCSHKQNPPGIQIYSIPPLNPGEVADILQFISPERKIVIGESVTRIIEGEPFTNPYILDILSLIRKRFPRTTVQITSNGALIDREKARFLANLGQIEINLSLNSTDPVQRKRLMNDQNPDQAVHAAAFLADAGIRYHGSIVAMPHITGWSDLGRTLNYLAGAGASTIRVFLPGFTKLAPASLKFAPVLWPELHAYVERTAAGLQVPVTVEPGLISDLRAEVKGVIPGSPAAASGLLRQDLIIRVGGKPCFSRVDAFQRIKSAGPVTVDIVRDGIELSLSIDKAPGASSGLVMEYDIDPDEITAVSRAARKYKRVRIMCSVLAAPLLQAALQRTADLDLDPINGEIIPVQNAFFGGTIKSAGLLLVPDFIEAFREGRCGNHPEAGLTGRAEAILVPSAAFDRAGLDLAGNSYLSLQEATGLKVEIV